MRARRMREGLRGAVLSICMCACGSGGEGGDTDAGDAGDDSGDVDAGDSADVDAGDGGDDDGDDDGVGGCVKAISGRYLVRGDEEFEGALLYAEASGAQTPVLEAASGLPLLGAAGVHDGYFHGCAVRETDSTAWCWRVRANGNLSGQLGNGTMDGSGPIFRATQVMTAAGEPLQDVASISYTEVNGSVGASGACAVTTDGGLYCWGDLRWIVNGGDALLSPYAVPITTDGATLLSGVTQAAVYAGYACAVRQGTPAQLWCWGQNGSAQLGQGDTTPRQYPTRVQGLDGPSRAVLHSYGGYPTTCVVDESRVRCWGQNGAGQVGADKPEQSVLAPALVTTMDGEPLDDVVDLHGGNAQFCAFTGSQAVWCWGQRYQRYAGAYGVTNVVALGGTEAGPRYLTSDGMYHIGDTVIEPECGVLP